MSGEGILQGIDGFEISAEHLYALSRLSKVPGLENGCLGPFLPLRLQQAPEKPLQTLKHQYLLHMKEPDGKVTHQSAQNICFGSLEQGPKASFGDLATLQCIGPGIRISRLFCPLSDPAQILC